MNKAIRGNNTQGAANTIITENALSFARKIIIKAKEISLINSIIKSPPFAALIIFIYIENSAPGGINQEGN